MPDTNARYYFLVISRFARGTSPPARCRRVNTSTKPWITLQEIIIINSIRVERTRYNTRYYVTCIMNLRGGDVILIVGEKTFVRKPTSGGVLFFYSFLVKQKKKCNIFPPPV